MYLLVVVCCILLVGGIVGVNDVMLRWGVCLFLSYWIDLEFDYFFVSIVFWFMVLYFVVIKKISIII